MKRLVVLVLLLVCVSGCSLFEDAITGDRLQQVNDGWLKMYSSDRKMTTAEAEEYSKLTDEQKLEWRRAGKPSDRPHSTRTLDATKDFHKSVNSEAEEAK